MFFQVTIFFIDFSLNFLGEANLCSCTKNVTNFWSINGSHTNLITPTNVGFLIGIPSEEENYPRNKKYLSPLKIKSLSLDLSSKTKEEETRKAKSCIQNCSRWVLLHKKDTLEITTR